MRKGIALGVAKGLLHLHEECGNKIIHRDIKAANILLNADFEAIIADLELGMIVEHHVRFVEDAVCGTAARIAPEYYQTGECSEKSDVYGYGMFLLEIITGQRHFNVVRVKKKYEEREWENIVDANGGDFMEDLVEQLTRIALICTSTLPEDRLKMSEVVGILENEEGLAEKSEEWYKKQETGEDGNKNEEGNAEWKTVDDDVVSDELSGPR